MKLQFITIIIYLIFSTFISNIVYSDDIAYGIWNLNNNQAAIGIINLSIPSVTVKYTFSGYQHVGKLNFAFDLTNQQISCALYDISTNNQLIATVNVKTWKEILPAVVLESVVNFTSIVTSTSQYDNLNLFATFSQTDNDGVFYEALINPSTAQFETDFTIHGLFSSSYFTDQLGWDQTFTVWTNITTGEPMVTIQTVGSITHHHYEISNVDYSNNAIVGYEAPYNLVYIQGTNQAIGNINLIDKSTNSQYAQLFVVNNPPTKTIENLSINNVLYGLTNCNCLTGSTGSIVYAVYESTKYPPGYSLVKWDINNKSNPLITQSPFPVNLLNMFFFETV